MGQGVENRRNDWHGEETYKSLITYGNGALRFVVLINGGGLLSLLGLYGNLYGNLYGKDIPVPNLTRSAALFLVGLFFSGLAFVGAYLTQLVLYNVSEGLRAERRFFQHQIWLWLTVGFVVIALLVFCLGSWLAINVLAER